MPKATSLSLLIGLKLSLSEIRLVNVLNPISDIKLIMISGFISFSWNWSNFFGNGTSVFKVTSSREMIIFSKLSMRACLLLGCLISPARSSKLSRSPYSLINSAAVLTPIPGAPGMLSTLSPAND